MAVGRKSSGAVKGVSKPPKRPLDGRFSDRLRDAMNQRQVDVPTMAKDLGVTRAALHRYLKYKPKTIEAHIFLDICEYLDCPPRWLLTGPGTELKKRPPSISQAPRAPQLARAS